MIVEERMKTYINSLDMGNTPFLQELEAEALADRVPIIRRDMQSFMRMLLAVKQPKRILEVGTAVGFSTLLMCEYGPEDLKIVTIENYEKRIPVAKDNFRRAGRESQITLLEGDAGEILKTLTGTFDMIFMDAAKGQYIHWLPDVLRLMKEGSVLVSDNVLQEGDIIESHYLVERRNRTIYKRMREYLWQLTHSPMLRTSVLPLYGADAVYIGGEAFGLRAKAKNFSKEDMREGIAFAHAHGVKVYVTVNILAHNRDLEGVREYLQELKEIGPDALIIADPGIFMYAKEICPEIERHISTQANNTNYETYRFWYNLGAKRVVSARELSLEEIREIRAHIPDDMEIETFIHGAMCISYSGRCLLSNFMAGRDANQGACTHPCRWKYSVVEEKRPGEYMPVFENERGTFIFNSKDLCMVEHMEDILTSGIDSLKIEGRMKTALYVATVARTYRKAIDDCMESPEKYHANMPWYQEQISNCTYRQFTTGFFYGKPDENTQIYDSNTYVREYTYLGFAEEIDERGLARLTQRNKFSVGETIEIMKPDGRNIPVTVEAIYNEEGESMESAPHAQQRIYVKLNETPEVFDILRRGE